MSEQAEFLKSVRESLHNAQAKAQERFGTLNGDAKKVINDLVEKGKTSQKDIADRLNKLGSPEVRAKVEQLGQKAKDAQARAIKVLDSRSREQAGALAVELRKLAERLDKLSKKDEPVETAQVH